MKSFILLTYYLDIIHSGIILVINLDNFMQEDKVVAYLRAYYVGDGIIKVGRVLTLTHGVGNGKGLMLLSGVYGLP